MITNLLRNRRSPPGNPQQRLMLRLSRHRIVTRNMNRNRIVQTTLRRTQNMAALPNLPVGKDKQVIEDIRPALSDPMVRLDPQNPIPFTSLRQINRTNSPRMMLLVHLDVSRRTSRLRRTNRRIVLRTVHIHHAIEILKASHTPSLLRHEKCVPQGTHGTGPAYGSPDPSTSPS